MENLKQNTYDCLVEEFNRISSKITNKRCKKYFYEIINQYSELCAESGINAQDEQAMIYGCSMNEWLHNSVRLLSKKKKYQKLMADINLLADRWDDRYNRKANENCDDYKIRHKFFLSTENKNRKDSGNSEKTPYACCFNPMDCPDDRIILIVVDNAISLHHNYKEILHEVGHYIGCRKRTFSNQDEISRREIGREMIAQQWINTVYKYVCADILHIDVTETYGDMQGDISTNVDKRRVMHNVLYALCSDSYYLSLLSLLEKGSRMLKESIVNNLFSEIYGSLVGAKMSYDEKIHYAEKNKVTNIKIPGIRRKRKELICIEKGYLNSEISLAMDVFKTILEDEKRTEDMENAFICEYYPEDERDVILEIYKKSIVCIRTFVNEAVKAKGDGEIQEIERIKALKQGFHWVYLPECLLEDIAADVFFCRIGGVEKNYIDSFLKGYALQETKKKKLTKELVGKLINTDSYRYRVVALTAALGLTDTFNEPNSNRAEHEQKFINKAHILSKIPQIYGEQNSGAEVNQISSIMRRMNCVDNPTIMAIRYARMILSDIRYNKFIEDKRNRSLISRLRRYGDIILDTSIVTIYRGNWFIKLRFKKGIMRGIFCKLAAKKVA